MVENEQQPPPPATGDPEADAAVSNAAELQKKKRRKCIIYITLLIIFHAALITVFDLTVMKVRTPKFRLTAAKLTDVVSGGAPASASLRVTVDAEFSVRNANFGRYRYGDTAVEFFYRGNKVGEVTVPKSRANWRSTRKYRVEFDLNLGNGRSNPQLSSDLSGGAIPITSSAKMKGMVDLLFFLRKNRSADLKCSMEIAKPQQQQPIVRNIECD